MIKKINDRYVVVNSVKSPSDGKEWSVEIWGGEIVGTSWTRIPFGLFGYFNLVWTIRHGIGVRAPVVSGVRVCATLDNGCATCNNLGGFNTIHHLSDFLEQLAGYVAVKRFQYAVHISSYFFHSHCYTSMCNSLNLFTLAPLQGFCVQQAQETACLVCAACSRQDSQSVPGSGALPRLRRGQV